MNLPTRTALLFALVAAAATLMPAAAVASQLAEPQVSWSVQPAGLDGPDGRDAFDYSVEPGTTISDRVAVSNFSAQPVTFRVYASDAVTDYNTGSFTLVGATQASSGLGAWTSVDSSSALCPDTDDSAEADCAAGIGVAVTLEPNSRAVVPFTVTVPFNATPGDHAAGIVAEYTMEGAGSDSSAVSVSQRVGSRIYLRVGGELTSTLAVSGVVSGFDGSWNPIGAGTGRIGFELTNTGNTRVSALPTAQLTGPFGIPLGKITLDPVENLLPGQSAYVTTDLPGVAPLVLLFADVEVTGAPAAGAVATDELPAAVRGSAVAWAIPWSLLGVLVLAAGIVFGIRWWRLRSRHRLALALGEFADQVRAEAASVTSTSPASSEMSSR